MYLRTLTASAAALVAATLVSAPSVAATPIQVSPTSYIFGSSSFNDTTDFSGLTAGSVLRFNIGATSNTSFSSATATFNAGTSSAQTFTLTPSASGFDGLFTVNAISGINSLLIAAVANSTNYTGSYSGSLTVLSAAVPEVSTWAMMTLGFGALGYSLRRRRTSVSFA